MPGTTYSSSVSRNPNDKLGEHVSILDFGAIPDGVTDASSAFTAALNAAIAKGEGIEIYFPGGTYALAHAVSIPSGCPYITISGDGEATILKWTGGSISGGIVNVESGASGVTFRDFVFDGNVTSSTGVLYSTVAGNPMQTFLTDGTSFWIKHGVSLVTFNSVVIRHTGGYAILFDCAAGLIDRVRIVDCTFENNRPHLFGTSGGDLSYGSWTGGVFVNGDGQTAGQNYVMRNFVVQNCVFRRNTGNCLWSHLNGFGQFHQNFRFLSNHFEDCGLDGILVGGVSGGVVDGNVFHRTGYVCSDDTSASVPKYLTNAYATALDTYYAKGVNYTNNSITSANGASMDLDGFSNGVVSGNTARIPASSEPEYVEDSVASMGTGSGPITYGAQVNNSANDSIAGSNIEITNNQFINQYGGAIRLYACRNTMVSGNLIQHPGTAPIQPIRIGPGSLGGANQQATNIIVTKNQINYDPNGTYEPCVYEDPSLAAFTSTDVNWVFDNQIVAQAHSGIVYAFQFLKDPNSGSVAASNYANATVPSSGAATSHVTVQTEGTGDALVHRTYHNVAGTATLLSGLAAKLYNSTPSIVGGPIQNVSANGAAGSGSYSTGARSELAFDDCVATGRLAADAFISLTDLTFTYPNDAAADLLPDTFGVIRYNSTSKVFQKSISVSGGHRVWVPLADAGGSDTQVQYNSSGGLAGSSNFVWNNTSQLLTVTGIVATAGISIVNAFVQSDGGFLVGVGNTATNAIYAQNSGVTAKWLIATDSVFWAEEAAPALPSSGQSKIYMDSSSHKLRVSQNGAAYTDLVGGVAGGSDTQVQYNSGGGFAGSSNFTWTGASQLLTVTGIAATAGISVVNGFVQSDGGFLVTTSNTATNAIYAQNCGVTAKWLIATDSVFWAEETAPALPSSGQSKIYMDSTSHKLRVSQNGAAYVDLVGGSVSGLTAPRIPFAAGATSLSDVGTFYWDSGSSAVFVPGLVVTSTASNGLQVVSGGTYGGIVAGQLGINGVGAASAVRISIGAVDDGMFLGGNTGASSYGYIGIGVAMSSAGAWTAKDTEAVLFRGWGSAGFAWYQNTGLTVGATFSPTTIGNLDSTGFWIPNNHSYQVKDSGGTARSVLYLYSSNDLYLDNIGNTNDVYVRPASGRYVFLGLGSTGVEVVAPNGTGKAQLGNTTYRWGNAYVAALDATGVVQSQVSGASIAFQVSNGATPFQVDGNGNVSAAGQGAFDHVLIATVNAFRRSGGNLQWSNDGSTWNNFSGSVGGVTSLNSLTGALSISGGTGVSVSPSGSTITVSIGQDISSSATPLFAGLHVGTVSAYASIGPNGMTGGTTPNVIYAVGNWLYISDGTDVISIVATSGSVYISALPSSNPGAGTKKLWYDPSDGNRVKYAA